MQNKKEYKLWGSAFKDAPDSLMIQFTVGHDVYAIPPADEALIPYDIQCNIAQVKMLGFQKIISQAEMKKLLEALKKLTKIYQNGEFKLDPALEDVHTNIENWVAKNYGSELAGKIHTGRSRNDQVVTDMYLYLHDNINKYIESIGLLVDTLAVSSKKYKNTICPGFTHHQHATVTSFGLILDSFKVAFERDITSFKDLKSKFNYSPLGACVGYGSLMNINPEYSAKELGFVDGSIFKNPIDVISNRGEFEAGLAFQITQFINHASNLAETLILFSTTEFGFVKLADQYSTGSSAMPQKKNPDPLELIKGIAAVSSGILNSLLQITNGNLIGYNRDSQETKYLIYHLIIKSQPIPLILKGIIETLNVFPQTMKAQANKGFINSMGLMELIMTKYKIPMREAKVLIEKSIKHSIEAGENDKVQYNAFKKALKEMDLEIDLKEAEFISWQDGEFQYSVIPGKSVIPTKVEI